MERGRVTEFRLELDGVDSRQPPLSSRLPDARLCRRNKKRHLRRVTMRLQFPLCVVDRRLVVQRSAEQDLAKRRILFGFYGTLIQLPAAFQAQSSSGRPVALARSEEFLHRHPVLCQGARLVCRNDRATAQCLYSR